MHTQYRSLDRTSSTAIFLASLLVSLSLLSSISFAFSPTLLSAKNVNNIEEIVIRG